MSRSLAVSGRRWRAIDAGVVVNALAQQNPEAILNITFGPDLTKFVRQGKDRGLFEGRDVVSFTTGEPEYLHPLGEDAPTGWIVTGYPVTEILDQANSSFASAYSSRYGEAPTMGSVVGHAMISSIVAPIERLGSLDTETMADGFGNVSFDTPFGPAIWRFDRPSKHDGNIRRSHRDQGQQGRHGGLEIQGGWKRPSPGYRSPQAAPGNMSGECGVTQ